MPVLLKQLAVRRRDDEDGFTLIELMVVVLIIAILIAIAIPTFLGARSRAQDRAAQSDLRNGLTTEKTIYTDTQQYTNDVAATGVLVTAESSLNWGNYRATGVNVLNVTVQQNQTANDTVCLSEQSKSGKWFALADIATSSATANAGTYYNNGTSDPCTGATPASMNGWKTSF
jgi:type IV pilus assembly protein PilA